MKCIMKTRVLHAELRTSASLEGVDQDQRLRGAIVVIVDEETVGIGCLDVVQAEVEVGPGRDASGLDLDLGRDIAASGLIVANDTDVDAIDVPPKEDAITLRPQNLHRQKIHLRHHRKMRWTR
jgi:hypothetical protein